MGLQDLGSPRGRVLSLHCPPPPLLLLPLPLLLPVARGVKFLYSLCQCEHVTFQVVHSHALVLLVAVCCDVSRVLLDAFQVRGVNFCLVFGVECAHLCLFLSVLMSGELPCGGMKCCVAEAVKSNSLEGGKEGAKPCSSWCT